MDLVLFSPVPFEGTTFIPEDKDKTDSSSAQKEVKKPPPNILLGIVVGSNQSTNSARTFQIKVVANAWENFKASIKPVASRPLHPGSSSSSSGMNTATGNNPARVQNKNGYL